LAAWTRGPGGTHPRDVVQPSSGGPKSGPNPLSRTGRTHTRLRGRLAPTRPPCSTGTRQREPFTISGEGHGEHHGRRGPLVDGRRLADLATNGRERSTGLPAGPFPCHRWEFQGVSFRPPLTPGRAAVGAGWWSTGPAPAPRPRPGRAVGGRSHDRRPTSGHSGLYHPRTYGQVQCGGPSRSG
jgi:hypothetical protein